MLMPNLGWEHEVCQLVPLLSAVLQAFLTSTSVSLDKIANWHQIGIETVSINEKLLHLIFNSTSRSFVGQQRLRRRFYASLGAAKRSAQPPAVQASAIVPGIADAFLVSTLGTDKVIVLPRQYFEPVSFDAIGASHLIHKHSSTETLSGSASALQS